MTHRFKLTPFFPALLFALFISLPAQARLDPEPIYKQTLLDVVETLQRGHYNRVDINDQLSSALFDRYLDTLDPSHSYFYAADVAEFEKWRTSLDDQIKNGELSAAYTIFNRFEQRNLERLDYIIARLEDESVEYDFTLDESIDLDRKEAPWIESTEEMNDLWRRRVKNALLSLKLADKSVAEAREILLKRYRSQKQRAEQTKSEDVFQTYVNSLTAEFDPHTQYYSPISAESFRITMSLSLEGIGAVLQGQDEMTKIVSLVPAGPAEKSGQLKPADLIVGVAQGDEGEFEDVVGWRLDDVVQLIRGPKDTVVRLQIIPSDAADQTMRKTVRLVRSKVKLEEQAAKSRVLQIEQNGRTHKIGVISIPAFYIDFQALQSGDPNYKSTTRDVHALIDELKTQQVEGLIIDLRDNGGGSLREANELVGLFISRGPTVQIRDPDGRVDILGDFNPEVAWNGPLTVIVNRLSASASEIFAGAIQDYQRGLVVGSRTFGKGTVQVVQEIDHGQIKMTHSKFYRISGESTQHKGVNPDIQFPTLYDENEIGESSLDSALPWDKVRPVRYGRFPSLTELLPTLSQMHHQRTDSDPDFLFMNEQIERLKEKRSDRVSLNENTLKEEREKAESWVLDSENRRRRGKGLDKVESLAELEQTLPKDEQGRTINPEAEALLNESAHIMLDMINLASPQATAQSRLER
ncbi:tail-specific protease [Marinobacterium zhoushanense]|uniref:Tail-specific protease n=1 Tax=Marinobacterium zhoushanense TaxID=1679163 RepID=A0ABQ1K0K6_9GAMM|nr:carboxy terminal-processing peptidase [Marinobacterium zhoushanense]GGB79993.1 tail-specific protease [Marinobacterium zhoushanense]